MSTTQPLPPRMGGPPPGSLFAGPGELRALCRAFDWASTPLGAVDGWSASLRTAAQMVLASGLPCILLWGRELIQVYNDAYAEIIRAKHPLALGRGNLEIWPEVAHINGPIYERVFRGETVTSADALYPLERSDVVEDVYLTLSFSPVLEEGGEVGGVLVNMLETTQEVAFRALQAEREELFRQLEVERARLELVFREAPAFLAVLRGPDHVFTLVNEAYCQLVGRRDLLGRPLFDAVPEARGQGYEALLRRVLETGEPATFHEIPVQLQRSPHAEPETRYLDLSYRPVLETDGRASGVIAHGTDVTEQVLARQQLDRLLAAERTARRQSEERLQQLRSAEAAVEAERNLLRAVLDQMPNGVSIAEAPSGRMLYTNPAGIRLLGHEQLDTTGAADYRHYGAVHADGSAYAAREYPLARALTGEVVDQHFMRYRRGDGRITHFSVSAAPVYDAEGRIVRAVSTWTDVSDRVHSEAALRHAKAEAEQANRAKSEFLAAMSHELRTPLNAISGYVDLMDLGIQGPLTEAQRTGLSRIRVNTAHLTALITDILQFAKLEAGTLDVQLQTLTLGETLSDLEDLVHPQLHRKGVRWRFQVADPALRFRGDVDRVRQILLNLVGNAIKFTDPAGLVGIEGDADDRHVHIRVIDTGRGIPAADVERIFEPFVQLERNRLGAQHQGVGLGLPISRELARRMGGDIVLQSEPGQGARFTLLLPRAPTPTE